MRRFMISIVALALVAAACGDDELGDPTGLQLVASDLQRVESTASADDIAEVARAEREFAAALYAILTEESDNLVFSPISIQIAMAMVLAGAEGETEAQIAAALGVDDIPEERMHAALNALDVLLEARNRVEPSQDGEERKVALSIVNSLWGQAGFDFRAEFLDVLAANYGAGMRVVDFKTAAEAARQAINEWVAEQTNDRITDLLPEGAVDDLSRLVLTNAVYLDATWAEPFDPNATTDRVFILPDGTEVTVPTMYGSVSARYARGDGWQALDLAYTGGEVSMLLILPDEGRLAGVEASLQDGLLDEVNAALADTEAQVSLPKFEIRTQADLVAALSALGMSDAFDPARADFTGIGTDEPLYISGVLHEAFISVDEAGTEAAAATAVIIGTTSMPTEIVEIDFDRPFLFSLQDRETGTALFLGRVLDPR